MHRLASSFVLAYHGCDREVGEALLNGAPFRPSSNEYDWLGHGIYFREANPLRGLEFAREKAARRGSLIREPFVVGAVVELGLCLDLTTTAGIDAMQGAYANLCELAALSGRPLPANTPDGMRRDLDCAVFDRLHTIVETRGYEPIDTIRGIFTEGPPAYPGAGFPSKSHIQIAVRNVNRIRGLFRVPKAELKRVS